MNKEYDFCLKDMKIYGVYVKGFVYRIDGTHLIEIHEHQPRGEGDRYYYDVVYSDGSVARLFEFSEVVYIPTKENNDRRKN